MPPPEDGTWWCQAYAADGIVLALRRHTLERRFLEVTQEIAAKWPPLSSTMLAFAQFWNDNASDEVHVSVFASDRRTPDWPHECPPDESWPEWEHPPKTPRDLCSFCGSFSVPSLDWGYGELVP